MCLPGSSEDKHVRNCYLSKLTVFGCCTSSIAHTRRNRGNTDTYRGAEECTPGKRRRSMAIRRPS
jgi:hypothetical protein